MQQSTGYKWYVFWNANPAAQDSSNVNLTKKVSQIVSQMNISTSKPPTNLSIAGPQVRYC